MIVQRWDASQNRWRYFKLEKVKSGLCKEVGETDEYGILFSLGGIDGKNFGTGSTLGSAPTPLTRKGEDRSDRFNWPADKGPESPVDRTPRLPRTSDCFAVGDRVVFGRRNGQKTAGRVVKINLKSVKVETEEVSGKYGQVKAGTVYRVHPSLVRHVPEKQGGAA